MKVIIKIGAFLLQGLYNLQKRKAQKKQITIISRQANAPTLDISLLAEQLGKEYPEYQVVILCKKIEGKVGYIKHMLFEQMPHLAVSKVVVLDSYCILVSLLRHRPNLTVVQMWHAMGAYKKFGKSILDQGEGASSKVAQAMQMHRHYDTILASSPACLPSFSEAFGYEEDAFTILPLPRTDLLRDKAYWKKTRAQILADYPELADCPKPTSCLELADCPKPAGCSAPTATSAKGAEIPTERPEDTVGSEGISDFTASAITQKKTILYAPTFRKGRDVQSQITAFIDQVDFAHYNLILSAHPLMLEGLTQLTMTEKTTNAPMTEQVHHPTMTEQATNAPMTEQEPQPSTAEQGGSPQVMTTDKYTSLELLSVSDYFVTDYSAMAFEAAVAGVPTFFYTFDIQEYEKTRGFYLDPYHDLPTPPYVAAQEVVAAIEEERYDGAALKAFADKYVAPGSDCTAQLATLLIERSNN